MARKHNRPGRMIPREVRTADTAARLAREAAMTPAEHDRQTIRLMLGSHVGLTLPLLAETWLGLSQDPDLITSELDLRDALAREITRRTGEGMSEDLAYSITAPEN